MTFEVKKLVAAFPEITNDFIILLVDRVIDNKFTVSRIQDSINNIIDNFQYKRPNISDIISFDKRVKLYTYGQLCDIVCTGIPITDFSKVKINNKIFWVSNSDKTQFNIKNEY